LNVGNTETEEAILKALDGAQGDELLRKLATLLAAQERKIDELASSLHRLTIYEKHSGAQLFPTPVTAPDREPTQAPVESYAASYQVVASDYLLEGDGFHAVEHGAEGLTFRWAAKTGTMRFAFYVDRSAPLDLELVLFNSVDPQNYEQIRLTEAGEDVPIVVSVVKGRVMLTSVLQAREHAGETNLTFHVPHFRQLGNEDRRVAGVVFHKLTAAPREAEG
jgi:hypothetical protein